MLNRNDDQNEVKKMVLFCVAAASTVLLLFLVVLYMHDNKNSSKHVVKNSKNNTSEQTDIEIRKSNIVSSDLDFWDMYDKDRDIFSDNESEAEEDSTTDKIKNVSKTLDEKRASSSSSKYAKENNDEESSIIKRNKDKDEMDDGKHIKVTGEDGKNQWYEILDEVKKNKLDFENYLVYDNGLLKYSSSDIRSSVGIDISNRQGIIDFSKVKNAGVDFIMIKVASRGYETGQINIDDKFVEYANGATAAGIPIGTYITSNAITDIEAVEEANYAVAAANNYNVKYPIAIDFTKASSDKTRADKLTSAERTAIVKKFCETVKGYGKTPAISASKEFLICNLDLEDLSGYDIWLKDEAVTADYMMVEHVEDVDNEDTSSDSTSSSSTKKSGTSSSKSSSSSTEKSEEPDYVGTNYPYDFSIWQYTKKGSINGIDGAVNINLGFVNYAER